MPTYHDPRADAVEASEALRGLAHASRDFDQPADTYPVLGDLLAGVRSLRQVLDQLAHAHAAHQDRAHNDDDDHFAGSQSVQAAADELHRAGTLLDQVHDRLDAAFAHSGRIAWHPEPAPSQEAPVESASRRWVSVVFLQGEEADEVLDLIDRDGTDAGIEHLQGFDYGEETTDAALENDYVYDEPPTGALDRVVTEGDYTLTYNQALGHVSLLRAHTAPPDPTLDDADVAPAHGAVTGIDPTRTQRNSPAEQGWFTLPVRLSGSPRRGLSL